MDSAHRPVAARPAPQASRHVWQDFLQRYATILAIATFAVSGISGVLIFFHIADSWLKGLHEWIGMAFVLAAILHVLRNFRPFAKLLTKPRAWAVSGVAALVAAVFIGGAVTGSDDGNVVRQYIGLSMKAPISAVATVAGVPAADLATRFEAAGITGVSGDESVRDLEAKTGIDVSRLFEIILGGPQAAH